MASTTNTKGAIAATAEQKTVPQNTEATPAQVLNRLLNNTNIQAQLSEATKGNAGAFSTSLLNLFNSDTKLQTCSPKAVVIEAMKAAVLGLPIEKSLGFAYVVPYWDNKIKEFAPQFQIGYRGMIQLCMRTGEYKYINADVVYEGEYQSADKLTGYVDLNGERTSDTVIGYFAYIETLNGFKKAVYWDRQKVMDHANRYSKSKDKQGNLVGPWVSNFDEMAVKTVLRNLLSKYGVMTTEMSNAFQAEEQTSAENPAAILGENTEIEVDGQASESVENPVPDSTAESAEIPSADDYPFAQ
ncbi:MAG: recombinase RecT [Oscillospiraceae bacterium]|nr:recombinase RecT [Oscillospiraceae bacterium]